MNIIPLPGDEGDCECEEFEAITEPLLTLIIGRNGEINLEAADDADAFQILGALEYAKTIVTDELLAIESVVVEPEE